MKALLLFFSAMLVFYGHSQNKIYDSVLQNYKYRTEGFTALFLRGGANNNFSLGNSISKSSSFSVNPSLEYFSVKSTDKRQITRSGYFNPGFWYQKQKNENIRFPKRNSDGIVGGQCLCK